MIRTLDASRRRGSALFTAVIVTVLLGTLALLFMTVSTRHQQESSSAGRRLNSFYAAEAGLNVGWVELQNGGDGAIASSTTPDRLGGLEFWVESSDLGDGLVSLVATGSDGHAVCRVELVAEDQSGAVSDFGVFGEQGVEIASNARVDSYDSTLGTYASQVSGDHALGNGNLGTNDDIDLASNSKIWGYAQYGPDDSDSISIGSTVTLADGYGAAETAITLDPIVAPSYASSGALTVGVGSSSTIGPGNAQYTTITTRSNSALTVRGPCNLVISSAATINSNSTWTFDASGGPINVYALGTFDLKSNSTVVTSSQDPSKLTLFLSGVHTDKSDSSPSITFASNSSFYGTIYAPDLSVEISSNFEVYGSVKAQWLELASNSEIHYDESLATGSLDSGSGYVIRAWRKLDGQSAAASE
jgi:hypothetical protein